MICSVTQLLINDVCQSRFNSTVEEPRASLGNAKNSGAVLATRFNCMQAWFLRCSQSEKFKFLTKMMHNFNKLSSLSIILNTLLTCSGKSSTYSIGSNSNFIYDKGLNDHNRALDAVTLKEVQENDLQWFQSLKENSEQVLIFIGLLRLGGGLIMYEIYKTGVKLFAELTSQSPESIVNRSENLIKQNSSEKNTRKKTNAKKRVTISSDLAYEIDPDDSFVKNTEACKKKWKSLINKYRLQVEFKEEAAIKLEKKPKKTDIKKKDKKKEKQKKKKKDGKSKDSSDLDFLQLIPIMLVKRIFGYLNSKTLKKIKKVNKYWEFAVNDMQKEMKGRKTLNKCIKKMKKGVPDEENEGEVCNILKTAYDKSYPKKRVRLLANRGAVLPKLVQPLQETLKRTSWMDKSDELERYYLQVQNLKLFPRSCTVAPPLHQQGPGKSLQRRYTVFDDLINEESEDEEEENPQEQQKIKKENDVSDVNIVRTPNSLANIFD